MVIEAMTSSALGRYHLVLAEGSGIPKAFLPSALRMMVSKCSRAAVVAGDDSTEREVAVDGIGDGMWVARNM